MCTQKETGSVWATSTQLVRLFKKYIHLQYSRCLRVQKLRKICSINNPRSSKLREFQPRWKSLWTISCTVMFMKSNGNSSRKWVSLISLKVKKKHPPNLSIPPKWRESDVGSMKCVVICHFVMGGYEKCNKRRRRDVIWIDFWGSRSLGELDE